jgi:hypothetical protein
MLPPNDKNWAANVLASVKAFNKSSPGFSRDEESWTLGVF